MATDYERIISEAIEDCGTIQEAINEVKIVSPRYGEDFKSLPMIAAEFQDAINTIVVDDGVPAVAVSDSSGKTQQAINDEQKAQNNSFKSMLRKTPYDFGAKGGSNDDTQAVIDCINSGYFLINDVHNCRPFKIENKQLDGEFSDKGRLIAIPTATIDTFEFFKCSGEIRSWYMSEAYTSGVYASFLLRECKNMDVYRLFVTGGKLVPVAMVDCDECFIYNSAGIGFVEQRPFEWALVGSRNSQYINCHLYNHQFGFVIIGSAYKSGTRLMTTRPILETLGMKAVGCTVNNATRTCFDINGAVGAEFLDCIADQQGQSLASPGFQIKQSTVAPEESGLDTYMNKITNPTAINCATALQMQDGHIAEVKNLTAINIKTSVLQLNKTPRCEIDGIYVYNFGLDMVNHNSASGKASVLHIQNGSGNCVIRNVNVVIDRPLSDPSLVEFISNTSNSTTIDGFKVTLLNSTDVFSKFLSNSGNFLKLMGDIRIGDAARFTTLIDDSATSTIYPTVISKVFDLLGATEVIYFDQMQSNGLVIGKVSTTALDLAGSDAQVSVGIPGNVAGLRGLAAVTSGTSVTNPNTIKITAGNTPIVCRRQAGTTGTGKVLIQVRGFELL